MQPATTPRHDRSDTRLLAIDRDSGSVRDLVIDDLPGLLRAGDLLVVNDAATLPASLHARVAGSELMLELRLTGGFDCPPADRLADSPLADSPLADPLGSLDSLDSLGSLGSFEGPLAGAVLLGAGDWRTPTEHRAAPPRLVVGDTVLFQRSGPEGHALRDMPDLRATITAVDPRAARLVTLRFDRAGAALWSALYRLGRPVQYSYLREPLALWSVQTGFATRPWAAEMPSAGRPLSWSTLLALRRAGVEVAGLTHAAGLSSTGDPQLDALLPLPERYDLPAATVEAVTRARARGGRVIAAGTTVVRALEGCVDRHGALRAGPGETDLVLGAEFSPRVVDGLLTGMHDPSESHFQLLRAFAGAPVLLAAWRHASAAGYLQHEFGDATLLAPALLA